MEYAIYITFKLDSSVFGQLCPQHDTNHRKTNGIEGYNAEDSRKNQYADFNFNKKNGKAENRTK